MIQVPFWGAIRATGGSGGSPPEPVDFETSRVMLPVLPAWSVCDAVTATAPSGRPRTSMPGAVQLPLTQAAAAWTVPTFTVMGPSPEVQLPAGR